MVTASSTNYGCTKLQTFPYAVFGACEAYKRVTLATTILQCQTCSGSPPAPNNDFCKADDACDGTGALVATKDPGVAVRVNSATVNECALFGIIDKCEEYNSISLPDQTLGTCKTCNANFAPAVSVANANLCIPTSNFVEGCAKYFPSANTAALSTNPYRCAICTSGLPYNTEKGTCPKTAS
jgi:hypothetical protein